MSYLKIFFSLLLLFGYSSAFSAKQCVILLHGLTRSHYSMLSLETYLKKYHYVVINQDYPTTSKTIHQLAQEYIQPMINACLKQQATQIHFVTHSLGGIVLQAYLKNHNILNLGHIVMLSPPNHGSEVTDLLKNNWLYQFITGPAGQELTTLPTSTPNRLQTSSIFPIGVITGTYNFIPFGNYLFKGLNDGAVSVESAKLNAMHDFIAVNVSHPFIMDHPFVQYQVLRFLKFGKFARINYINSSQNKIY